MIRSMTGYGQAEYKSEGCTVSIYIRSVNSKNLDINLKLPENFISSDIKIRQLIKENITRGKIDLILQLKKEENAKPKINIEKISAYKAVLDHAAEITGLENNLTLKDYLDLPEVISNNELETAISEEELMDKIKQALGWLMEYKLKEGKFLFEDIAVRIYEIARLTEDIDKQTKDFEQRSVQNLTRKLNGLLEETKIVTDESRLYQEAAYIIEKEDITEEVVRLKCHAANFKEIFEKESCCGKKLDFISQEISREANTINSKTHIFEISSKALLIKSEADKIRQQLQNVE